jgi:hypothetical protein
MYLFDNLFILNSIEVEYDLIQITSTGNTSKLKTIQTYRFNYSSLSNTVFLKRNLKACSHYGEISTKLAGFREQKKNYFVFLKRTSLVQISPWCNRADIYL